MAKNKSLIFTVDGPAIPLARARVTRTGHAYLPERSRNYRTLIQTFARNAMNKSHVTKPLTGPVMVTITEIRKPPKRMMRVFPTSRPDLDNIVKAVLDALNGLVWEDDAQVVSVHASKEYGEPPKLQVVVTEIAMPTPMP